MWEQGLLTLGLCRRMYIGGVENREAFCVEIEGDRRYLYNRLCVQKQNVLSKYNSPRNFEWPSVSLKLAVLTSILKECQQMGVIHLTRFARMLSSRGFQHSTIIAENSMNHCDASGDGLQYPSPFRFRTVTSPSCNRPQSPPSIVWQIHVENTELAHYILRFSWGLIWQSSKSPSIMIIVEAEGFSADWDSKQGIPAARYQRSSDHGDQRLPMDDYGWWVSWPHAGAGIAIQTIVKC